MDSIRPGESISTGVAIKKDAGILLASVDELVEENVPFSRIYTAMVGNFGSVDVDWLACSATICEVPERRVLSLAQRGGHVYRLGGGESEAESLTASQEGFVRKPGLMREIRAIAGGRAYAVGTGRQAYRRDGAGQWTCIDRWYDHESADLVDFSFESIDGYSAEELYTVGWRGEIWHYDGSEWHSVNSPTNLTLHKVRCTPAGVAYASGKDGLLLRGRYDKWEIVPQTGTTQDIWGLEWYRDTLFASTSNFVYTLDEDELELVDYGDADIPGTCYHLSVGGEVLWSIGSQDVMQFDGDEWTRIV